MVPAGEIYLTAEPQFNGIISIHTDIIVLSADNPAERRLGWSIFENIGMALVNPMSVARIRIPQTASQRITNDTIQDVRTFPASLDEILGSIESDPGS
jgi:hypothetical protein